MIYSDYYAWSDNLMSQLVKKSAILAVFDSDALYGVALQDDAGKSPDFLELLVRYQPLTHNRIGNGNRIVRDLQDSNTVVQKERIPYDSQGNACIP